MYCGTASWATDNQITHVLRSIFFWFDLQCIALQWPCRVVWGTIHITQSALKWNLLHIPEAVGSSWYLQKTPKLKHHCSEHYLSIVQHCLFSNWYLHLWAWHATGTYPQHSCKKQIIKHQQHFWPQKKHQKRVIYDISRFATLIHSTLTFKLKQAPLFHIVVQFIALHCTLDGNLTLNQLDLSELCTVMYCFLLLQCVVQYAVLIT